MTQDKIPAAETLAEVLIRLAQRGDVRGLRWLPDSRGGQGDAALLIGGEYPFHVRAALDYYIGEAWLEAVTMGVLHDALLQLGLRYEFAGPYYTGRGVEHDARVFDLPRNPDEQPHPRSGYARGDTLALALALAFERALASVPA